MDDTTASGASTFSLNALKKKYQEERAKRLRADGATQYIELEQIFTDLARDPYVEPGFQRDAVKSAVDVAIVGAGFGGLLSAVQLRKAGVESIRLVDKAGDFGGTWYWNRYPGAACDVEAYIYMPLLEETGYMPTERYAKAAEIFAHCQRIAHKHDLYRDVLFQTEVEHLTWSDETNLWTIRTDRGDDFTARFVVVAGGMLHKPKLPGIPGIETFKGKAFHTCRWDYAYTGGSPSEPMDKLSDKRVGIIGTGATSIQAIPKLGLAAETLYVLQRTPSGVGVRANRPTDPEWVQALKPGWQQERMDNFIALVSGLPQERDLVDDGWTEIFRPTEVDAATQTADAAELADFRAMEQIRARVDGIVQDKATAEALKPWYNQMCKRPCFHDEYLDTFNRSNVHLVDTDGKGVERITPTGVVVAGKEYELDCLIYASGFEIMSSYHRRLGFDICGRDGAPISERWNEGANTLHGITSRGFPNLMMISLIQGGQAINVVHIVTEQSQYIAHLIKRCLDTGVATIEPSAEAEAEWQNTIFGTLMARASLAAECTPGYYNNEGVMAMTAARFAPYLGPAPEFVRILRDWRSSDELAGMELTYASASTKAGPVGA